MNTFVSQLLGVEIHIPFAHRAASSENEWKVVDRILKGTLWRQIQLSKINYLNWYWQFSNSLIITPKPRLVLIFIVHDEACGKKAK
jgi:hypothetical protein